MSAEMIENTSEQKSFLGNPFFRRTSSIAVLLLVGLVFAGWILGRATFVSILPQWPAVAPLTAACFFLTASAILLLGDGQVPVKSWRGVLLALCLSVVLLIALMVLGRSFFFWNLPMDMLLLEKKGELLDLKYPPELPPATAICFLLTQLHLFSVWFRAKFSFFRIFFSVVVLFQTLVVLMAYLYQAEIIYEFSFLLKMSVLTAWMFLILNLGLMISSPLKSKNISWFSEFSLVSKDVAREKNLYIGILVVFLIFLAIGVLATHSLENMKQSFFLVRESQEKITALTQLHLNLVSAETGQRGYILTGNEDYLNIYNSSLQALESSKEFLNQWLLDHPEHQDIIQDIESTVFVKRQEMEKTIALRRNNGFAAAAALVNTNQGRLAMRKIRGLLKQLQEPQESLLKEREYTSVVSTRRTVTTIVLGSLLAILLMAICLGLYMKNSLRRYAAENRIKDLNITLENKLLELGFANKELESFSYSVSHDLRAPLRAMSGFSNILLEDYGPKLDKEAQGYLMRIVAASDKMSQLINGILDISRIARRQLHRETLSLTAIASQTVEDLRRSEPYRQVEILIDPDLSVSADNPLMTTALQNLLGNAWKFTSKKDLAHIHFGKKWQNGREVFFVEDDGAGFDMAYAEKLFGTFQRLHNDNEFQGTGVGLASVRRVIHLHGGEVWAESRVGQGAVFYFTLNS